MNYENASITIKLVSPRLHREELAIAPSLAVGDDLSALYYIEDEKFNTLITDEYLEQWHIDVPTLHKDALQSMQDRHTVMLSDMNSIVSSIVDIDTDDYVPAYVLTVDNYVFGANAILYPNVLSDTREQLGYDFYLIPSSVHEWIIVPKEGMPEDMNDFIKSTNSDIVSPEERLSDHLYEYSDGVLRAIMSME